MWTEDQASPAVDLLRLRGCYQKCPLIQWLGQRFDYVCETPAIVNMEKQDIVICISKRVCSQVLHQVWGKSVAISYRTKHSTPDLVRRKKPERNNPVIR